jgi:inner membrane protein
LGAAVGEATLGQRVGRKAAAWGAVLGTLPDLDVVFNPFLDAVQQLAIHRSFSHSFLFALVAAPLLGWLLHRLHHRRHPDATWMAWSGLSWWCLATHILIDLFTVYGTQIFWPLTDHPYALDAIFIIDPLFTLPLTAGLLVALLSRQHRKAVWWGLAVSTAYLGWALTAKSWAHAAFEEGFAAQGIPVERMMSNPSPLNTILWMGLAEANDTLWAATYSLLDSGPPTDAVAIPRRTAALAPHLQDRGIERLEWFSKGWWIADTSGVRPAIIDPRFGRSDLFLDDDGAWTFRFELLADSNGVYHTFTELNPDISGLDGLPGRLWTRLKGR